MKLWHPKMSLRLLFDDRAAGGDAVRHQASHCHAHQSAVVPGNQWWTDVLMADHSYEPTNRGPRVIQQDLYACRLRSYPMMLLPNPVGFKIFSDLDGNGFANTATDLAKTNQTRFFRVVEQP
jgi:hypothetical protein